MARTSASPARCQRNGTAAINAGTGAWTFTPTDPDWFGSDSFEVTVTDDEGGTTTQLVSITLANVNDAPTLTNGGTGGTASEGNGHAPFTLSIVSDVDSPDFDGGTLTLTVASGSDSTESLYLANWAGVSTSGGNAYVSGVLVGAISGGAAGAPLVITFNSDATLSRVEAVYQSFAIGNFTDDPTVGIRNLEVVLTDGDGATSNTATAQVNFSATNDAPVIDDVGLPLPVDFNEQSPVALSSLFTASDSDSDNLTGAAIVVSDNYELGADVLLYTNMLGISGSWDAPSGTLTLSGSASVADYQTAIRTVVYNNTSDTPSTAQRSVDIVVTDGADSSNTLVRLIDVTAANDLPVATGNTVIATEDVPLVIEANDFAFTDVEGDSLVSVTITGLTLNGGTLTHSAGAVTVTNGMTVTATELADLTFTSALNDSTDSSFTYTVNDADLGVTSATMNITVNTASDAPLLGNNALTIGEGDTVVLSGTDLSGDGYRLVRFGIVIHDFGRLGRSVRRGYESG